MSRYVKYVLLGVVAGVLCLGGQRCAAADSAQPQLSLPPRISPDYAGLVVPTNIAPLNFKIEEPGTQYRVHIHGAKGAAIDLGGSSPLVKIPQAQWRQLLADNVGSSILYDISVCDSQSRWTQYQPLTNTVARDPIDGYLAYRIIKPLYNFYHRMGTYQRDLSTFEQMVVITNSSFSNGCINCHTFLNHSPKTMLFHARRVNSGNPMLLIQSNTVTTIMNTAGFLTWHPSGRLIAYSANKLSMIYHTIGETREVYDGKSDLGVYRVDENRVVVIPALARADRQETWPTWSPDGKYLYYCCGPVLPQERAREIRYDLMRIAYDIDKDTFGEPEMVISSEKIGLSCAEPRISPDGRYLLFCMCKATSFPLYEDSDLYLLELATGKIDHPNISSPAPEGWHCWSSNGHWVVFSSKRRDGLFTRPYFTWFDGQGNFSKPFILPQEDPEFYDSFINTYNLPEFIKEPITIPEAEIARAILAPKHVLHPGQSANGLKLAPSVADQ